MTGWNAIKSRAQQLKIDMTDAQYKECTAKIKALADIRPIAIDDADSIIHAFYRNVKHGAGHAIELPNMTPEEKELLAKKEAEMNKLPEKRALEQEVNEEVAVEQTLKKAKVNGITA